MKKVKKVKNTLKLSSKDLEIFVNSLLNPAPPNERLKEAMRKHSEYKKK